MPVPIKTIDLEFQGSSQTIAVYLIPYETGAILIESGPASTFPHLKIKLNELGYSLKQISDVFLTHIHLDHAGAAGQFAKHGARIHVHPAGAQHLSDPSRLIASAGRLYGNQMEQLWGLVDPVPPVNIFTMQDGEEFRIGGLTLYALHTPGHAEHHLSFSFEEVCFTGDVGGVRIPGYHHVRLPLVPPELNLEKWHQTLHKLKQENFKNIAPTHFGIFDDPIGHLDSISNFLDAVESWMLKFMSGNPTDEEIQKQFLIWQNHYANLAEQDLAKYEMASPSFLSIKGLRRYWQKYR